MKLWVKIEKICKTSGLSRRTVQRRLAESPDVRTMYIGRQRLIYIEDLPKLDLSNRIEKVKKT